MLQLHVALLLVDHQCWQLIHLTKMCGKEIMTYMLKAALTIVFFGILWEETFTVCNYSCIWYFTKTGIRPK